MRKILVLMLLTAAGCSTYTGEIILPPNTQTIKIESITSNNPQYTTIISQLLCSELKERYTITSNAGDVTITGFALMTEWDSHGRAEITGTDNTGGLLGKIQWRDGLFLFPENPIDFAKKTAKRIKSRPAQEKN